MLEFKITVSDLDYDILIPSLIPMLIKNKIAAKAAQLAIMTKIKNMNQQERDAYVASFLSEHKGKILDGAASMLDKKGIKGNIKAFEVNYR